MLASVLARRRTWQGRNNNFCPTTLTFTTSTLPTALQFDGTAQRTLAHHVRERLLPPPRAPAWPCPHRRPALDRPAERGHPAPGARNNSALLLLQCADNVTRLSSPSSITPSAAPPTRSASSAPCWEPAAKTAPRSRSATAMPSPTPRRPSRSNGLIADANRAATISSSWSPT